VPISARSVLLRVIVVPLRDKNGVLPGTSSKVLPPHVAALPISVLAEFGHYVSVCVSPLANNAETVISETVPAVIELP
jgi:hypothetical protein